MIGVDVGTARARTCREQPGGGRAPGAQVAPGAPRSRAAARGARLLRAALSGLLLLSVVTTLAWLTAAEAERPCRNGWFDEHGRRVEQTSRPGGPGVTSTRVVAPSGGDSLVLERPLSEDESVVGSRERFAGLDLVGRSVDAWTHGGAPDAGRRDSYLVTPFLLSSRGTGLLVDTPAHVRIDVGATQPGCLRITAAAGRLTAHTFDGPTPARVLSQYARVVGRAPVPPRWAFGVWKTTIGGRRAVLAELDRLADVGIPVDAVWLYDAMDPASGWGWGHHIYATAASGGYGDLAGFVRRLHARGLKVLGYLNPLAHPSSATYRQAQARDALVTGPDGRPLLGAMGSAHLDLTDPATASWFSARVTHALGVVGFDGAMQDFGDGAPVEGDYSDGRPGALVHNRYPVIYARLVRRAAQQVKPGDTAFIARSGHTGGQRSTTGAWTGDQHFSWDEDNGLPSVVPAMLSGSISGWPYWGPDIGGYYHDDAPEPAAEELWIRWVELGALSPLMRDHLGHADGDPVDLWTDARTVRVFRTYARLHHELQPYLHRMARRAHTHGMPLVRPLFLADPDDPTSWRIEDQYLLGDELLVAPVTTAGQRIVDVYLPAGRWCDVWTGRIHGGRAWWPVPAPVERIPVLVRADTPSPPLGCPLELG